MRGGPSVSIVARTLFGTPLAEGDPRSRKRCHRPSDRPPRWTEDVYRRSDARTDGLEVRYDDDPDDDDEDGKGVETAHGRGPLQSWRRAMRAAAARGRPQRVEDFMDEDDLREHIRSGRALRVRDAFAAAEDAAVWAPSTRIGERLLRDANPPPPPSLSSSSSSSSSGTSEAAALLPRLSSVAAPRLMRRTCGGRPGLGLESIALRPLAPSLRLGVDHDDVDLADATARPAPAILDSEADAAPPLRPVPAVKLLRCLDGRPAPAGFYVAAELLAPPETIVPSATEASFAPPPMPPSVPEEEAAYASVPAQSLAFTQHARWMRLQNYRLADAGRPERHLPAALQLPTAEESERERREFAEEQRRSRQVSEVLGQRFAAASAAPPAAPPRPAASASVEVVPWRPTERLCRILGEELPPPEDVGGEPAPVSRTLAHSEERWKRMLQMVGAQPRPTRGGGNAPSAPAVGSAVAPPPPMGFH
jgi:hypothetical protein